jgi:hypothetical protein
MAKRPTTALAIPAEEIDRLAASGGRGLVVAEEERRANERHHDAPESFDWIRGLTSSIMISFGGPIAARAATADARPQRAASYACG